MKQTSWSEDAGENNEAKPLRRPRRSNKPAMERRRRERINGCLEQLKNYVLVAEGKDPARYTKVEKADILEMTVRFLNCKKQQQRLTASGGNSLTPHYKNGYRACVEDLQRLLSSTESPLPPDAKDRLLQHLRVTAASGPGHESSDGASKRLSEDDSDNCITIRGSYGGTGATAKLVVRCTPQPQQHQTVYSTWSPPVAGPSSPPGLDGLCSPPSSPDFASATSSPMSSNSDCTRTVSNPSGGSSASSSVLTCPVLQPRNPNTHRIPSSSWATSSTGHPTSCNTSHSIDFPKQQAPSPQPDLIMDGEHYTLQSENSNTVCQQFRNLQPFHLSPAYYQSSPSPSPSPVGDHSEYRLCYSPPQSVPLNLAAPKSSSFKKEEEEEVHCSLSQRQVSSSSLQQHFRERLPAYPLQQDLHGSDPWRPWFN